MALYDIETAETSGANDTGKRVEPYTTDEAKPVRTYGFQKGQVANPNGRPKGARGKQTILSEALKERNFDVVDELVNTYRDPDTTPNKRVELLKAMLPYLFTTLKSVSQEITRTDTTAVINVMTTLPTKQAPVIEADTIDAQALAEQ